MIPALKKQVKAAEYRRFAAQATALAAASPLDHVREKHQLAADRWGALAALEEAPSDAGVVRAPWSRRDHVTPRIPPPAEDGCVV
jgi:hypothetical protein